MPFELGKEEPTKEEESLEEKLKKGGTLTFEDVTKEIAKDPELKKEVDKLLLGLGEDDKGKKEKVETGTEEGKATLLKDLLKEYSNIDIHETIGEVYSFIFERIGASRKGKQELVASLKSERLVFNEEAWNLDLKQKKSLGRASFVALSFYDIKVQPKLVATLMLCATILKVFKECSNRESIDIKKEVKPKTTKKRSTRAKVEK